MIADQLTHKVSRWISTLYDRERDKSKPLRDAVDRGVHRFKQFPGVSKEFFAKLYDKDTQPLPAEEITEGARPAQRLHQLASEVPEFADLQDECQGDEHWSGLSTAIINKAVVSKMQKTSSNEDLDDLREEVGFLEQLAERGIEVNDRLERAQETLEQARERAKAQEEGLDPAKIRGAFRKACKQAGEEIGQLKSALSALGYGNNPGQAKQTGRALKEKCLEQLQNSQKLKEIAELAGRLRRIAAAKQRAKPNKEQSEVTGIETGNALERLLPVELLNLAADNPEQELLFYNALLEEKALQTKVESKEPEGRGPIVICLDESYSMEGGSDTWSKAVSLALLEVAQRQKRSWYLVHFSDRVKRTDRVVKGQSDPETIMSAMTYFAGGGTDFEQPLTEAVRCIKEDGDFKKADILLITDGCSRCSEEFLTGFEKDVDRLDINVLTVLVNGINAGPDVTRFSSELWTLPEILQGSKGPEFEHKAFSI